eukprot:913981-Prorocentrum_minimum.AAC.1
MDARKRSETVYNATATGTRARESLFGMRQGSTRTRVPFGLLVVKFTVSVSSPGTRPTRGHVSIDHSPCVASRRALSTQ